MDNAKSLHYFSVLADTLSFTEAAKLLFISQQALSKQIQKLEEEYDAVLLERRPHIRLTQAGLRLLEYYRKQKDEDRLLRTELRSVGAKVEKRRISVSLVESRCRTLLPGLLRQFRPEERRAVCSYVSSGYSTAESLLQTGSIQMYFGMLESSLHYGERYPLLSEKLCLLLPRALLYRLSAAEQRSIPQFMAQGITIDRVCSWKLPWILPWTSERLGRTMTAEFERVGYTPEVISESYPFETALSLCKLNMGIAVAFQTALYNCIEQLRGSDLLVFPLLLNLPPCTLGLVTFPSADRDPILKAYIESAVASAEQLNQDMNLFFPEFCSMQLGSGGFAS